MAANDYDDPAHDADMRELRREQLRADISAEEADEELRDLYTEVEDEYEDWPPENEDSQYWLQDADIVLNDEDEEDRHWVVVHHQPKE